MAASRPQAVALLDTGSAVCVDDGVQIGEFWAFRDQPKATGEPVHRVEIVRVAGPRKQRDLHVRFHDGPEAGLQEWISRSQLVARWSDVEQFLADDRRWASLLETCGDVYGTPKFKAAKLLFAEVTPKDLVRFRHTKADAGIIETMDLESVASRFSLDANQLRAAPLAFTDRLGMFIAPWSTSCEVAERIAPLIGGRLLEDLLRREDKLREELQSQRWNRDDKELRALGPVVDVLRQWCGKDDVERYDELRALRQEVARLGELVQRAVTELRQRKFHAIAATIERDLGVLDANAHNWRA